MNKKIAFVFPGQGSQYVGMGKDLLVYEEARQVFEEASDAIDFDIKKLCLEGDIKELTKTENTQPALVTVSVAAYQVFMRLFQREPSLLAGHSLGEISALTCAGALELGDAVKIARKRGQLMQKASEHVSGSMAAISGIAQDQVTEACLHVSRPDRLVVVSNYNSSNQTVVSGMKEAVNLVCEMLEASGARIQPLQVSAPFHSPIMTPAASGLEEELQRYSYKPLTYPVLSNVTAEPYVSHEHIVRNLKKQMTMAVQWHSSMQYLVANGIQTVIELGPKNVLKKLMNAFSTDIQAFSLDKVADVAELQTYYEEEEQKLRVERKAVLSRCLSAAVCIPNKNWNNDEYQKGVIEPYQTLKSLQEQLEKEQREPGPEEIQASLTMLETILQTKKASSEEKMKRYEQVLGKNGEFTHLLDQNSKREGLQW